jgi:uncharacterized protein with PhoU and TrkA domain
MADPDPVLTAIRSENAELERQEREFNKLDERAQLAVMLDIDDPDEAERLFAALCTAKTDEEFDRANEAISSAAIRDHRNTER